MSNIIYTAPTQSWYPSTKRKMVTGRECITGKGRFCASLCVWHVLVDVLAYFQPIQWLKEDEIRGISW